MKYLTFILASSAMIALSCSIKPFSSKDIPPLPDYAAPQAWAALPTRADKADLTPDPSLKDLQSGAPVDVFFLHPTIYWKASKKNWNGSLADAKLNQKVDESTILFQASIFNGAGRVYAPRYRQAHLRSFFTKDKKSAEQAINLAYEDIRRAFEYYLAHFNQGRPIIIAAHSQGARHGYRLLKEFFDEKPLKEKLVAAYLVGWPISKTAYRTIPPCETPAQTGCVCSWRSFKFGFKPRNFPMGDSIIVTNPLTWVTDPQPAGKSLNEGSVLRKFDKIYPGIADAQVNNGLLWVHKPKFPGSFFFTRKNYHIADFNFFYVNVRKNAQLRAEKYFKERAGNKLGISARVYRALAKQ